jgi:hypothetical protein
MDEQLFPQQQPTHPQSHGPAVGVPVPAMNAQLTNLAARLKLAEERYSNLVRRNQITEESLLQFERDTKSELRALTTQAVELRKHLQEINTKIDAVLGELGVVVHKHELSTVERYLDLWQPLQFVTAEQARRMVRDAVAARAAEVAKGPLEPPLDAPSARTPSVDNGPSAGNGSNRIDRGKEGNYG